MNRSNVAIYSIDGNIGSGKSTFIEYLKKNNKNSNIIFLPEPVDEWNTIKDENEITIIEKFYGNNKKYAFSFQMMAYISRLAQIRDCIKKCNEDTIIIMERCVFTDKNVFAKMLYDNKMIEEVNYKIYNKWFEHFISEINFNGIIYIKTDPKIAHERVIKRGRKGEVIELSYLENCSKYHDEWINSEKMNTLTLDGNFENNDTLYECWCNNVEEFIKTKFYTTDYECKWLTGC